MPTTIFTWPTLDVEFVTVNGFSAIEQDDVLRFSPDVGQSIDRVRHTATVVVFSITVRTDYQGMLDIDDFYRNTIKRVGRFQMLDPLTLQQSPLDVFKFVAPPDPRPVTNEIWDVGLNLHRLT